jgi:hypothetical protein
LIGGIVPLIHPKDFEEIPDKFQLMRKVSSDLTTFSKYANFEIDSLESVRVAESVH